MSTGIKRSHYGRRTTWRIGRGLLGATYGLHVVRQEPGGGPALRDDRCWRNAAGLFVNTPRGFIFVVIRNLPPKESTR